MNSRYGPVVGDEKFEDLIDEISSRRQQRLRDSMSSRYTWLLHVVLLMSSIMFCIRGYMYSRPTTRDFVNKFSTYSPVASIIKYSDTLFNATTSLSPPSSQYIGHGSAVDSAWDKLTAPANDIFSITDKELYLLEKDQSSAQLTDTKTGRTGWMASLEVFHQLRCLDVVRRATDASFWEKISAVLEGQGLDVKDNSVASRKEVDHCLEILRMNLMCTADIGLLTYDVVGRGQAGIDQEQLKPDFGTWHTCRNFEAVVDWARDNAVDKAT